MYISVESSHLLVDLEYNISTNLSVWNFYVSYILCKHVYLGGDDESLGKIASYIKIVKFTRIWSRRKKTHDKRAPEVRALVCARYVQMAHAFDTPLFLLALIDNPVYNTDDESCALTL